MRFVTRYFPSFFISWLLTFSLASLFHSQYIVNQLVNIEVAVSWQDRIGLTLDDWLGLLPTYGAIIALALLLAFLFTGWLVKRFDHHSTAQTSTRQRPIKSYRTALFAGAGVVAFVIVLTAIGSLMNIHLIAGARGWGFYAQLLSGAVGGYAFAKLSILKSQKSHIRS